MIGKENTKVKKDKQSKTASPILNNANIRRLCFYSFRILFNVSFGKSMPKKRR
jgi:hypothetical protein